MSLKCGRSGLKQQGKAGAPHSLFPSRLIHLKDTITQTARHIRIDLYPQ